MSKPDDETDTTALDDDSPGFGSGMTPQLVAKLRHGYVTIEELKAEYSRHRRRKKSPTDAQRATMAALIGVRSFQTLAEYRRRARAGEKYFAQVWDAFAEQDDNDHDTFLDEYETKQKDRDPFTFESRRFPHTARVRLDELDRRVQEATQEKLLSMLASVDQVRRDNPDRDPMEVLAAMVEGMSDDDE